MVEIESVVLLCCCLSGFTDKEFDDVKGIFLDTSAWLFGLTIFISVFHVSKSRSKTLASSHLLSLSLSLPLSVTHTAVV